jgi:sugar lactone lactonase YvrE
VSWSSPHLHPDADFELIFKQEVVPESPANVCFRGKDRKTLFITARTGFYSVSSLIGGSGPK